MCGFVLCYLGLSAVKKNASEKFQIIQLDNSQWGDLMHPAPRHLEQEVSGCAAQPHYGCPCPACVRH